MPTVAVIGLGRMGQPIARNLLKAGYEVVVYNRTPEKAEALVSEGARSVSTPGEAARTTGRGADHGGRRCGAGSCRGRA